MTTISRILSTLVTASGVAFATAIAIHPVAAETITVTLDKSEILRIGRAASTVVVGQPGVADVQVESPRLILVLGKAVGETNLVILDGNGDEIGNYSVLVVPESDRHVTIFHGGEGVSTLSCNPRCAGVRNPGTEQEPEQKGGGGGGAGAGMPNLSTGGGGAPPAAPAAAPSGNSQAPAASQPSLSPGATMKQGEPY